MNRVWVDLETGGLDPVKSCILQIAAIRQDGETFVSYVKPHPDADVQEKALQTNRITREQLGTFPEPAFVADQFLAFLKPQSPKIILAGHNLIHFDRPFLDHFFARLDKTQAFESMVHYHHLDTLPLALALQEAGLLHSYNGYMNLSSITKALGIINTKEHDALGDVRATKESYEKMLKMMRSET